MFLGWDAWYSTEARFFLLFLLWIQHSRERNRQRAGNSTFCICSSKIVQSSSINIQKIQHNKMLRKMTGLCKKERHQALFLLAQQESSKRYDSFLPISLRKSIFKGSFQNYKLQSQAVCVLICNNCWTSLKEAGLGAYHYYHYTIVCVKTASMIRKAGE